MKKLLLILGVGGLSSIPLLSSSSSASVIRSSVDSFSKQSNGDYSIIGFGSVSAELQAENILYSNLIEDQFLHFAENIEEERCYVYVKIISELKFDTIDISNSLDINNDNFKKYDLTLVSYNLKDNIYKYYIKNLNFDKTSLNRRYSVRQIFNKDDSEIKNYVPIGIEYNYKNGEVALTRQSVITIPRKLTAFRSFSNSDFTDNLHSKTDYFVAFDTDLVLEKISKVKLSYEYFDFGCTTTIGRDLIDLKNSKFFRNFDQFNTCDTTKDYYKTDSVKVIKEIYPSEVVIDRNFARNYKFNNIEKTSNNDDYSDAVKQFEWICHFEYVDFKISDRFTDFLSVYYMIPWKSSQFDGGGVPALAKNISDVTLLNIYQEIDGEFKNYLVVDTYSSPINDNEHTGEAKFNFWKWFKKCFKDVFSGQGKFNQWLAVIVTFVIGITAMVGIVYVFFIYEKRIQ